MQTVSAFFKTNRLAKFIAIALAAMFLAIAIALLMPRSPKADNAIAIPIAIAAPLTGSGASGGQEMVDSIQLYADIVNREGGINGHPIKLLTYDDKGSADGAQQVAQEIVKTQALVVLGHRTSDASIAAGSIYQDNKLSAITGTANNEKVTADRPYYFRMVYTNSTLASVLSIYAQQVLQFKTATIVYDNASKNEQVQSERIRTAFGTNGTVKKIWALDSDPNNRKQSIQQILNELAAEQDPGILFLTLSKEDVAEDFLVALRQRGLKTPVLGDQALSREAFAKRFDKYDEEKKDPGFFTDGMYVASPLLFDSAGADAQEFVNAYQKTHEGKLPSYLGGKFYEAAIAAVDALRKSDLQITPANVSKDRELVNTALGSLNSRKVALRGLTGPIYFNANRDSDQPVRVAQFQDYKLLSASQQFTTIANPKSLNLPAELQAGNIVQAGDQFFWRQRVVYTGIDLNKLNRIDKASFTTDFYIWFRFNGNDDPVQIQFPDALANSVNPTAPIFDPKAPLKAQTVGNGINYRLYRVRGEFRNAFDFRDYPFDSQNLTLRFDNPNLSSDRLVYVIDTLGLKLPKPDAIQRKPFQGLQLWDFKEMSYFQDTSRSSSTQGDPDLFQSTTQVDYPGFSVRMTLKRKTLVFLTKNLLPLILLALLTYCALFFPYNMFVPRTMAPASALLSGIVLLLSFNNQLPEVGYTVALEYIFYTYFGLCLIPIIVTAIGAKLEKEGYKRAFRYLNISARILYPMILIALIWFYAANYGSKLF
ncbi:ABC transporter substrate-binding protein [Tumidithrix helvetica PCC 7403]|uniref:ABC transporter substrate-binding protein n=1 Tax=Tumidithrix helvetica TaxID=3457545 RepID=UPI003CBB2F7A